MSQKSTDTENSLTTEYTPVCCQNPKYCSTRETCPGKYKLDKNLMFYRAIDKMDRLGWEGVKQLLGKGRRDESGDFTEGCGYSEDQIEALGYLFKWTKEPGLSNEQILNMMRLWFYVMNMKFDK